MSGDGLSAPEQVEPGVVVHRDVFVRTRDGVGLATDIYRPARTRSARPAGACHSRAHALRQVEQIAQ